MARTLYYSDITTIISRFVPKIVDSDVAAFVSNIAIYEIFKRYDWRESLVTLPPFFLVPNSQDHGAPFVAVPSDFLGLRQAYLVQLNSSPVYKMPLGILKDLAETPIPGIPQDIGYQVDTQSFRVFPRVPANIGAPNFCIQGVYKKRPTKLTATTISSTLIPFDDMYLSCFVDVWKWAAWQLSGDPRAGGVQKQKDGSTMYTGQYAVAMEAIDAMAANEGVELGDVSIAPQEQLAPTSRNGAGWYGIGQGWYW